jgi:hypothetical protein
VDVQEHPTAVDVGRLKARSFVQAQAAGVDRGQAGPIDRYAHTGQNLVDLLTAQHHRELLLATGTDKPQSGPLLAQGLFVKELDPAQSDGRGGAGHLLDVGQVQKVPAEVLLAELVGAAPVVLGELADRGDVALLGPCGVPPQLHILDHAYT